MNTRPLLLTLGIVLIACSSSKEPTPPPTGQGKASPQPEPKPQPPPAAGQVTLSVVYGSEKKTWLEEQAKAFQAAAPKTKSGKAITVKTQAMGSGEATQGILSGQLKPVVFSP